MEWFEALILGLIQGLTEFLPVSSSGHLVIGKEILGINVSDNLVFETTVHAATVLSTITILRKEIIQLIVKLFALKWNEETQYVAKILVAIIPILIVGLFFKDFVEEFFGQGLMIVGIMLIVTAILLFLTQFIHFKERKDIGFGSALIIGIAQAVAVMPGLSRSGSTIATGLLIGVKKDKVTQFSFLIVIIPVLGECLLNLLDGGFSAQASGIPTSSLIIGFITAYLSGLAACKFMIELVKKYKLTGFAIYCTIVGCLALLYSLI